MKLILKILMLRRQMQCWMTAVVFIALVPFILMDAYQRIESPDAALTAHNDLDRPIGSYWVNDQWGGNGGVTCCGKITGKTAKVVWILSMSRAQEIQGMNIEWHETTLPMPVRKAGEDVLHVYFRPGNRIELLWASTFLRPPQHPDDSRSEHTTTEAHKQ